MVCFCGCDAFVCPASSEKQPGRAGTLGSQLAKYLVVEHPESVQVDEGEEWKSQGRLRQRRENWECLLPGMGAVSTTFMAGVELVRTGKSKPVGSLTQMGTIRLGKRTEGRTPRIKEFVPLSGLNDLVFAGWDIYKDNAFQSARNAGVLSLQDLAESEAVSFDDQADEGSV